VLGRSHANAATTIEANQPDSLSQHGPVLGEQANVGAALGTRLIYSGWIIEISRVTPQSTPVRQ